MAPFRGTLRGGEEDLQQGGKDEQEGDIKGAAGEGLGHKPGIDWPLAYKFRKWIQICMLQQEDSDNEVEQLGFTSLFNDIKISTITLVKKKIKGIFEGRL